MSWIRLDDQIAHHPKFTRAGLSSWLWVCCIGYSQKFLTDGFIPDAAVSSIAGGVERPKIHITKLVRVGLLDRVDGGYNVHDYLQFNDSAATVKAKREADRVRKDAERNPRGQAALSGRNPESVLARAPAPHPIPSLEEQKISAAASPRAPRNGNGHDPERKPQDNIRVITKLVHTIMDGALEGTAFADIKADVKSACSKKHIAYDADVVGAAIESALVSRATQPLTNRGRF